MRLVSSRRQRRSLRDLRRRRTIRALKLKDSERARISALEPREALDPRNDTRNSQNVPARSLEHWQRCAISADFTGRSA